MTDVLTHPPGYHGQLAIEDAAFVHATTDFDSGRAPLSQNENWHTFPEAYRGSYEARWRHLTMGPEEY